jgi:hypothetical protein
MICGSRERAVSQQTATRNTVIATKNLGPPDLFTHVVYNVFLIGYGVVSGFNVGDDRHITRVYLKREP